MKQTTIFQNRNLVDYAEYHDLVMGTENKNTDITESFRRKVINELCEIWSSEFPNNKRAIKEAILHGQIIRDVNETQYVVKERFSFARALYEKFEKEVIEGDFIYIESGYPINKGAIVNTQEQCREEFKTAWEILEKHNLHEKFFHRMAKRKIEEFLFSAQGQKIGAPNQAWMDLFGLNEGVCQALRKWFDQNLLLTI